MSKILRVLSCWTAQQQDSILLRRLLSHPNCELNHFYFNHDDSVSKNRRSIKAPLKLEIIEIPVMTGIQL